MLTADLELARAYLAHNPPPGTLLLCGITGAHLYGFPSPDSDLDLKGIHLAPTAQILGLDPATPPHDCTEIFQGVECDLTTNEASDALRLLLSGNGNMLERILSPMQTHESPQLEELRALAIGTLSQRYARHYGGFARVMRRELTIEPTVKKLLYAYRVLLTGITLLRSGLVEPNVTTLAPEFGLADSIAELVDRKRSGAEHAPIDASILTEHEPTLEQLAETLVEAEANSPLPYKALNSAELNSWLVRRRLSQPNHAT
jgi:uncharacterized protein